MAAADIETGDASAQDEAGGLFQGMKFWLSHTIPQRSKFISQISADGGVVVNLEKDADVKLVDHTRKVLPPDTYSYQFVEKSIRKGRLEKLEDHIAGSYTRNTRPVGDLTITTKGGRTPFTAADDQFLWDYVKPVEETGGSVKGNEIYKQIAAANPRHTFQSWRDRWIRHVSMHKMQSSNHREPTQPKASSPPKATGAGAAPAETASAPMRWQDVPQQRLDSFTKPDFTMLLKGASDIANMEPRNAPKAWAQFAKEWTTHTATEWQALWEKAVKPKFEEQEERRKLKAEREKDSVTATNGTAEEGGEEPVRNQQARRSPSFQPESPSLQSSTNRSSQGQRPISNEARKRSPMRKIPSTDGTSGSPPAKRKRDELEDDQSGQEPRGPSQRNRRAAPEIPPSTQTELEEIRNEMQNLSNSEQESTVSEPEELEQPFSPLFVPEEDIAATPRAKVKPQGNDSPATSPMNIRLSLDPTEGSSFENDLLGPSAQAPRLPSEELGDNAKEAEETLSEDNYETARTENATESEQFETAPQGRLETQAILLQTQADFDFELPEPEGGWDVYEGVENEDEEPEIVGEQSMEETPKARQPPQPSYDAKTEDSAMNDLSSSPPGTIPPQILQKPQRSPRMAVVIDKEKQPALSRPTPSSTTRTTDLPSCTDLDTYLQTRLAHFTNPKADPRFSNPHRSILQPLLLRAVRRTLTSLTAATPTSFLLADKVFTNLANGQPIPDDIKGIWTEEDDHDLMGGDARGVERVRQKHGDEGMRGRWEVLDVIGLGGGGGSKA